MTMDITLPEVKPMTTTARFFNKGDRPYVELSFVGSKDTAVQKVTPAIMAQFKPEWDAFCDGRPMEPRAGTPLATLPLIGEERAAAYVARNVHTLEELAALNDIQCQSLGHGTLTDRTAARAMVMRRHAEAEAAARKKVSEASASVGPVPAEKYAGNSDVEALKGEVAELKQGIGQIMALLQARKGGRPKKPKQPEQAPE